MTNKNNKELFISNESRKREYNKKIFTTIKNIW